MNNFKVSVPILNEILAEKPDDINTLLNYALTILKIDTEKNFDEAVECYKKIIFLDPKNLKAHNMLSMIHYETKKYSLAYDYYLNVFNLTPDNDWAVRQAIICLLGELQQNQNSKDIAIKGVALSNILKTKFKLTASDCINLSIFHRILGNSKENIENALLALELEPTESYFLYSVGNAFRSAKDYNKAIEYFEKALLSDKGNLFIYNDCITCLLAIKDNAKALEMAKKAVDIKETSTSLNQLGWVYCELEEYDAAKKQFLKALNLHIDNPNVKLEIKNNLIFAFVMANQSQQLLELMDSVNYQDIFNDDFSRGIKVVLYLKISKYEEVSKIINVIQNSFFPENSDVIFKAFTSFNLKKENWSKDCIELLKDINIIDNQYITFKEDLARCLALAYREEKNADKALEYFIIASQAGGRNALNWYDLGISQLYLDKKTDAADSIKNASECENCDEVKPLKYFNDKFKECEITDNFKFELMLKFFEILTTIYRIKNILKYSDTSSVYHYTKLEILKELVKENAKLRLSNAAHLNDPQEGTAILKVLKEAQTIFENTDTMRPPNVFLTSFCYSGDELPLWVQYASDGTGCSLEIDSNFFDTIDNDFYENTYRVNEKMEKTSEIFSLSINNRVGNQFKDISDLINNMKINNNEELPNSMVETLELISQISNSSNLPKMFDFLKKLFTDSMVNLPQNPYCLYRVGYIDSNGDVINLKENNKDINDNLGFLNKLIADTKKLIDEMNVSKSISDIFNNIIKELLLEIQYLFKVDSYMHEKEVRILKRASIDATIVKEFSVGGILSTLYIEVDKKLHFNKCILGPKVPHPSKIAPALYKNGIIDKVEASKIKYR